MKFEKIVNILRRFYARNMDARLLLNTGIENIDTVYGGVRGTTLSSRHNLRHWQTVVQSGVKILNSWSYCELLSIQKVNK